MSQEAVSERRDAVKILFSLGLSPGDIANALYVPESAIINDIKKLGGTRAFPNRKSPAIQGMRAKIFQDALMYYIQLRDSQPPVVLKMALEKFLKINEAALFAHAALLSLEALMRPQYPPERENYYQFMAALFGERALSVDGVPVSPNGAALNQYLNAVEFGGAAVPTRGTLGSEIIKFFVAEGREFIAPIWREDSELYAEIDRQINRLPTVECKVIRMHFGMGYLRLTLEEIATELGDYRDHAQVRQIEARAIRQILSGPDAHKLQKYMHVLST